MRPSRRPYVCAFHQGGRARVTGLQESYLEVHIAGQIYRLKSVEMLPEESVLEWAQLITKAQQQLGPVSTGIGVIGSAGWVAAGALLIGTFESLLTSAAQKEALRMLRQADKLAEEFRWSGRLIQVTDIKGLDRANPLAWRGTFYDERETDLRHLTRSELAAFAAERGLSPEQVGQERVLVKTPKAMRLASDEFICGMLAGADRRLRVRWSSVQAYRVVVEGQDLVVPAPPPPPPDTYEYMG